MTVMTEQIACVICDAPGVLRLDLHPQQVEHPRRGARPRYCELPPRDTPHPEAQYRNGALRPARAVCGCDTRVGAP